LLDDGWSYGNGWTMGDQFKNYLLSSEDPNKWQQFIDFNESAFVVPLFGFVPDLTDTGTYEAGMRAVRERYEDLFRGYYPEDQVDATLEQLRFEYEAAGMNELLEIIQGQIDEWLLTR
jgi:putative aldouronate transport system substrate-binding protein